MNKLTRAVGALAVVTAATFPISGIAHASPNTQAPNPPQPGHGSGGGGFGGGPFGGGGGPFGGGGLIPRPQAPQPPPIQQPPVVQPPAVQQAPEPAPPPPMHQPPVHQPPVHQQPVQQEPQDEPPAPPVHKPDSPAPAHAPQQQPGGTTDGPHTGPTDPSNGPHTGGPTDGPLPAHTGGPTDGPLPAHTGGPTDGPLPAHTGGPTDGPLPAHTGGPTDGPLPAHAGGPTPPGGAPGTNAGPSNGPGAGRPGEPQHPLPPHSDPGQSTVISRDGTTRQVPIAASPRGVPASDGAVEAARTAPPKVFNPATPPPASVNFNDRAQHAIRTNVDHDEGTIRPRHWDYIDYDEYHRPQFFNPTDSEMSFRYFYGGEYRTVVVPVGGRIVLDAAIAGVYPITVIAGDIVSAASFIGGAFIPPDGWVGPPPDDWAPYQPVVYDSVPVDFVNANDQVAMVDRVTMVGHDDNLPEGQRDVFTINDSTLARGQVTPAPDGGPPRVSLQQTQPLPGVGPWDDGRQYVNTQVTPLAASHRNLAPWIVCGLAAVLAALGGIAAWVWKHPRGALASAATANAPTETFDPVPLTNWMYDGPEADRTGGAWSETGMWRRPPPN